jgi:hypothetical protein
MMDHKARRVAASAAVGLIIYVSTPTISPHPLHAQPLYSNDDAHAPEKEPAQSQTQFTVTITSSAAASVPGSSVEFSPHWAGRLWAAD